MSARNSWEDVARKHGVGISRPTEPHRGRRTGRWVLYLFGLILQVALLGFGGVLFYTGIHTDDWVSFVAGVAALTSFLLAHEYDWRHDQEDQ